MNIRLRLAVPVLLAGLAVVLPGYVMAQGSAKSDAQALISGLDSRNALPPVAEQAKLESATPAVCRALGEELAVLPSGTVLRVAPHLASSANGSANAALLIAVQSKDTESARACMDAVATMEFDKIAKLKPSVDAIRPGLAAELENAGTWQVFFAQQLEAICSLPEHELRSEAFDATKRRMHAVVLILDLFLGKKGFRLVGDALLAALAANMSAAYALPAGENPAENPGEGDAAEADEKSDERGGMSTQAKRLAVTRVFFREVFRREPSDFGIHNPDPKKLEAAVKGFWEQYANTFDMDPGTWRQHLRHFARTLYESGEQCQALLILDNMCGGIRVPIADAPGGIPKPKKDEAKDSNIKEGAENGVAAKDGEKAGTPKKDGNEEDANVRQQATEVPLFPGDNEGDKITFFKSLDRNTKQHKVIRVVEREFEKRFGGWE